MILDLWPLSEEMQPVSAPSGYAFGIAKTGFSSASLRDAVRGVSLDVTIKYACDSANRGGVNSQEILDSAPGNVL